MDGREGTHVGDDYVLGTRESGQSIGGNRPAAQQFWLNIPPPGSMKPGHLPARALVAV